MELLLHWVYSCEPSHQGFSVTVVMIHALWVKCWYFVSLHNNVSTRTSRFRWKVGGAKDLMELLLQQVHSCEPSHLRSLQIGMKNTKEIFRNNLMRFLKIIIVFKILTKTRKNNWTYFAKSLQLLKKFWINFRNFN